MDIRLTTYKDIVDHVVDFLGGNPSGNALRDARRATLNGYRDLTTRHRWTYFYQRGRLNSAAPYQSGTIQYVNATRTVTLTTTDGTSFPSWASNGVIAMTSQGASLPGNVLYEVASNPTPTTLILTQQSNPGIDIPAGTIYVLYQDTYSLPVDCVAIDRMIMVNNAYSLYYEHPSVWLERQRIYHSPAVPRYYTIRGNPNYFGSLALSFFPAPDQIYPYDFIYQRRARPLIIEEYSTGTVRTTTSSATLTGTGTAWTPNMVGSVLRISPDNQNVSTSLAGSNPPLYERVIVAVGGTTLITLDAVLDQTLGPLKYTISDPVDLEEGAMLTAMHRSAEFQVSMSRNKKDRELANQNYRQALIEAMEVDSRNFSQEAEGAARMFPYRLAQMPFNPK